MRSVAACWMIEVVVEVTEVMVVDEGTRKWAGGTRRRV